MLRTGTGGFRSGAVELQNHTGASIDLKAYGSAAASQSETYKEGKGYYDDGKSYYDQGRGYYEKGKYTYDTLTAPPPAERYSGLGWNSATLASDPSLAALAKILDDAAAQGQATRDARENDVRKRSAAVGGVLALFGPMGAAAGAALYAFTEGAIQIGKLFNDDHDSPADRDRAKNAVRTLWEQWCVLPPFYDGQIVSSRGYAEIVETYLNMLNATDAISPLWQEEWRKTMVAAISSPLPMARDVAALGWLPFSMDSWCALQSWIGDPRIPGWAEHLKFNQCVVRKTKPGFLSAERPTETKICMPPIEEFVARTDRYAAGIAVALATRYGVRPESVVEAAIAANHAYLHEIGPIPTKQAWRMKGVFFAAWDAAGKAPKLPVKISQRFQSIDSAMTERLRTLKPGSGLVQVIQLRPGFADLLRTLPPIMSKKLEDRGFREIAVAARLGKASKS